MLGAPVLQERLEKNPPWHEVAAVGALCLALVGEVVLSTSLEKERDAQTAVEPATAPAQPLTS